MRIPFKILYQAWITFDYDIWNNADISTIITDYSLH